MKLAGELDSAVCHELIEGFDAAVARGPAAVILDLEQVTFMDSAGLRAIVVIERAAREREIALRIESPAGPVADLLRVTGIDEHVPLTPRVDEPPPGLPFTERVELELLREPTAPATSGAVTSSSNHTRKP